MTKPKKVMIIGGGPAGCEAARVLVERGHKPVLFEAGKKLGGNLLPGGAPSFKEDDLALAKWYADELDRLGVEVHFSSKMTANEVKMLIMTVSLLLRVQDQRCLASVRTKRFILQSRFPISCMRFGMHLRWRII